MPSDKSRAVLFLVIAVYAVITLSVAWPLLGSFGSRLPVDDVDPLFNTWVTAWNGHSILTNPLQLFSANVYYPYSSVLAYSDLMLPPSLLVIPVSLLTGNPIIAYNLLVVLSFIFSATAMFLLARLLTGNRSAAFLAGLAYAFSTYRMSQMGHLQLLMDGLLVMMVYFAHIYLTSGKWRHLALAGIFLSLQALSGWYYGFYAMFILALFILFFVAAKVVPMTIGLLAHLAAAGLLIAVILIPFTLPYLRLRGSMPGFTRTLGDAVHFSASVRDYLSTKNPLFIKIFGGSWVPSGSGMWEHLLFPGFFAVIFSTVAIVFIFLPYFRAKGEQVERWKIKLFYILLGLSALTLSFGPYIKVGGFKVPMPYLAAWRLLPGFKAMRVPSRFGLLFILSLVVLASYGFQELALVIKDKRKFSVSARYAMVAFMSLAILATQISWPFALSPPVLAGDKVPAVYRWLAKQKGKTVIELPSVDLSGTDVVGGWNRDVRYVYYSTYHWNRLVNGYSGYTPPEYSQIIKVTADFPDRSSVAVLRRLGIDYLIYHTDGDKRLMNSMSRRASALAGVKGLRRFGDEIVFKLKSLRVRPSRRAITAALFGPRSAPVGRLINIAWRIRNDTDQLLVIKPNEQPVAEYSWDDGPKERAFPRLPLVLEAGRSAWMRTQINGPGRQGRRQLKIKISSQLLKDEKFKLTTQALEKMPLSLSGRGLRGRFIDAIADRQAMVGSKVPVSLSIKNTGRAMWVAKFDPETRIITPFDKGEVHLAASWYSEKEKSLSEPQVFRLEYDIGRQQRYDGRFIVDAPGKQGNYRLRWDIVALGVVWFEDLGINNPSIKIDVLDKGPRVDSHVNKD